MTTILTNVADIFSHGNRHMKNKFKYLSPKSQEVIKYIINKLRKYRGEFWESNKTISLNVGCCIRTVQSSIRKAQKLGILQVSERYEKVVTSDKMRRTTNIIRLLPFKEFSIVKEITEKVISLKIFYLFEKTTIFMSIITFSIHLTNHMFYLSNITLMKILIYIN